MANVCRAFRTVFCGKRYHNRRQESGSIVNSGGPEAYGLIRDLLTPDKPANKSYDEIVAAMKDHLNPKPLVIAERYKFHKRVQKEGESVAQYLASLRKLAEKCEFGEFLDQALRDKLVCGMQNEMIQRRLLTEKELTAARAYEIARGMEAAHQQSTQLQTAQQEQKAHKVTSSVESKSTIPCWRCGKLGHLADQCFFSQSNVGSVEGLAI